MHTPFTQRTQSFYTRDGSKVSTYKEHGLYVVVVNCPDSIPHAMGYRDRRTAIERLNYYTIWHGGKAE